ncbi:alpha/beta hydrolase [Nocardia sp. NPDC046473]|uniref:alpha/beta fold hydrolase n=1 Tax=Nocardia sp. NPDC046473 TaxID=3155733 RepID=UPI0033FDA174
MQTDERMREVVIEGARLRYLEVGEGDPLVLLHGYPQNHHCWRHQITALATERRVIAPDLLGWGASDRNPALRCDYDSEVARIEMMFDEIGLGQVDLAAHDYGGFLGLGFLLRHPERVRRFAIMNSRAHQTFSATYYRHFARLGIAGRRRVLRELLIRLPLGDLHRKSLARYARKGCFDDALLDEYVGWLDTRAGRRWFAHFCADYRVEIRPELAAGLPTITAPTAVIWGDQDRPCPYSIAEDLAARIPHATLTRIAGADHYVMEERPDVVTAALTEWLRP